MKFAVLDTETNWNNQVMSLGVVIADDCDFAMQEAVYFVFKPECSVGGMFQDALFCVPKEKTSVCDRATAVKYLIDWLNGHNITAIFAYNAGFDYNCLPELSSFDWYDIMRIAAYRQYNPKISPNAPVYSTGRMKRGYGVEPILRMLLQNNNYFETHNAMLDAYDELQIMRLLGHKAETYIKLNS